ncbi:MAG: ABC transporter permease [Thermoplasmata archaeon]
MERRKAVLRTHMLFRQWWRALKRGWSLFRQSRLGLAGLSIILAFGVMAAFAPLIAPYPQDFLAPEQDLFLLKRYPLNYTAGPEYQRPVVGPSVPTFATLDGGQWIIVADRDGHIFMDFGKRALGNETPFELGNASFAFDIRDFGLEPPLSDVLYVAQGLNFRGRLGDLEFNGLLAFVANETFVLLNPFVAEVVVAADLGFRPTWISQDPTSAGDMDIIPTESSVGFFQTEGPFRYFAFANTTKVTAYRVEYVGNEGGVESVQRVLDTNATVTAAPFAINNTKRDLPQSGIYVPSGETLLIYNVTGGLRTELNLTLANRTAVLTAPIGFTRGDFPHYLFLPLKSDQAAGVAFLSPSTDVILQEFVVASAGAEILTRPDPGGARFLHFAANLVGEESPARVYRVNFDSLESQEGFEGAMPERVLDVYFVFQTSRVMVLGESNTVYTITTKVDLGLRAGASPFAQARGVARDMVWVGSFVGTKHGTLSAEETHGLIFDAALGELLVHQFTGSIIAPLPPGQYPSGNWYIFGTDNLGHDILTHLIFGTRIAFLIGILAAFFAVVIGTFIGLVSGYKGKSTDVVLMRVTDIALVLPGLPIILILTAILGPNIWNIILIIAIIGWPGIARVIRAQTLSLRERPFVDAAKIAGASETRIMFRHLAPNVLPFAFLYMTLLVAGAILTEAALSFLGLGDPRVVTWGIMLSTIQTSGSLWAWWWLLPPGLSITFISLGFYLVGRAADEIVNPRLRKR